MPDTLFPTDVAAPQISYQTFSRFVTSWNEGQHLETPVLHEIIAGWLDDSWTNGDRRLVLMVFRDAGKSTLVGLFAAWLLTHSPDLRILVVAAEQQLATKMTRNIRTILELHEMAAHIRPKSGEQWASDQFTIERPSTLRDPSVLARGIQGNMTGSRADIVICDDVEVPNTSDSPQKRLDLREKLNELHFILTPGGTQLYVGTPHCFNSIYAPEQHHTQKEERTFLDGFKRFVSPVFDAFGNSAWPERFPVQEIEQIRRDVGPVRFQSQMMLVPTHIREIRLNPERMRRYDTEINVSFAQGRMELSLGEIRMRGACCWWDPAYGRPDTGDSCVVACVFTDDLGQYWLHDISYMTFDPDKLKETDAATQLCMNVLDFTERNYQYAVTIENNGLGKFLPGHMRKIAAEAGANLTVQEHRSSQSKASRILEAFDPVLAAGHLFVHERVWASPFIEEMREWSPLENGPDDGLDAVSSCLAMQPVRIASTRSANFRHDWRGHGGDLKADTSFSIL